MSLKNYDFSFMIHNEFQNEVSFLNSCLTEHFTAH